jgi:hypothetical protein
MHTDILSHWCPFPVAVSKNAAADERERESFRPGQRIVEVAF